MHLREVNIFPENFPDRELYPFNLQVFNLTRNITFKSPVTFFIGENGTGKSTLLKAIARKCSIHIWEHTNKLIRRNNRYSEELFRFIDVNWTEGNVPGSFFSSEIFHDFAQNLDEWAENDPGMLDYYGGESLLTKSHGQYHMAFFKNRYRIKGLYLLDEPENALSPRRQLELLKILKEMSLAGHAQFIVATHSPVLLALPEAEIYSFDYAPVKKVHYEETDYYKIYHHFMNNRKEYIDSL